ncbi:hypothetical protein CQW23_16893 [Capsicum baccatum]|uniref:Ubiquitin-like protease family profile domain-containing protein n=1 Tax=Capsicum baccatum TaxID=33114 RepID=A0A2G2WCA7_CAPBA|nr:hypothetical protein CQW23_16893 [Capsicum baccatum]
MNYIYDTYTHYHQSHSGIDLSLHVENIGSMKLVSVDRSICEIMQGLCISAGIPWHLIDEVYVPINCKGSFHWVLAVIILKKRCIRVYDLMKGHRGHADEIKEHAEMLSTYLTIFDFFEKEDRTDWDCGLFVAAYAEFLSDQHQIPSSEFDSKKQGTRYTSLLWDYGVNKACTGYVSDNQDPSKPKRTFIRSEDTEMIDVEP